MGYDLMKMIDSKQKKIRHSNKLNATLSALPVSAKKSFLMALRQVDPRASIKSGTLFTIKAADYANEANIGIKEAYRQLRDGAYYLQQSYFSFDDKDIASMRDYLRLPDHFKKSKNLVINLMKAVSYESESSLLTLEFNDYILPLITLLKGEEEKYTTQILHSSMVLKSAYSYSFYQFLRKCFSSNKWVNVIEIDIDDLKKELLCYDVVEDEVIYKYEKLAFFKKEVLNKAIKEILSKTEFKEIYIENGKKEGKKVKSLKIIYNIDASRETTESLKPVIQEIVDFTKFNISKSIDNKDVIDNRRANEFLLELISGSNNLEKLSLTEATYFITEKYFVVKTED